MSEDDTVEFGPLSDAEPLMWNDQLLKLLLEHALTALENAPPAYAWVIE